MLTLQSTLITRLSSILRLIFCNGKRCSGHSQQAKIFGTNTRLPVPSNVPYNGTASIHAFVSASEFDCYVKVHPLMPKLSHHQDHQVSKLPNLHLNNLPRHPSPQIISLIHSVTEVSHYLNARGDNTPVVLASDLQNITEAPSQQMQHPMI